MNFGTYNHLVIGFTATVVLFAVGGFLALLVKDFSTAPCYYYDRLRFRVALGASLTWCLSSTIILLAKDSVARLAPATQETEEYTSDRLVLVETPGSPGQEATIHRMKILQDTPQMLVCEYELPGTPTEHTGFMRWNRREAWGAIEEAPNGRTGQWKLQPIPGLSNYYLGELRWDGDTTFSAIAIIPERDL